MTTTTPAGSDAEIRFPAWTGPPAPRVLIGQHLTLTGDRTGEITAVAWTAGEVVVKVRWTDGPR